jgi:UDPglucose 6-dehydrogenase
MKNGYKSLQKNNISFVSTDWEIAETFKYTWNTYLALRIAFINEINRPNTASGADTKTIIQGAAIT